MVNGNYRGYIIFCACWHVGRGCNFRILISHQFHIKNKITVLFIFLWAYLPAQQYSFIQYSRAEGLPQSQAFALCASANGYLWTGTRGGGVCRFDGRDFECYNTKHGLQSATVTTLLEDHFNRLWIGHTHGLAYFQNDSFHTVSFPGNKQIDVLSLESINDTTLWVGTKQAGVWEYQYKTNAITQLALDEKLKNAETYRIFRHNNIVWLATNKGAWKIDENIRQYTKEDGLPHMSIRDFVIDTEEQLWIATFGGGLCIKDTEDKIHAIEKPALKYTIGLFKDQDNTIWAYTQDHGILQYLPKDSTWLHIDERNGLPHNHIRAIRRDAWNNLWLASSGGGLIKYLGQNFAHFHRGNGLLGNRIYALAKDSAGHILFSASTKGIMRYDGQRFEHLLTDHNFPDVKCKAILEDNQRRIWIGTDGRGLYVLDTSGLHNIREDAGLPSNWIQKIVIDKWNDIWIATNANGLARVVFDTTGVYITQPPAWKGSSLITTLLPDSSGRLWYATKSGTIGYVENGLQRTVYGKREGLPSEIKCLALDSDGNLYAGTTGSGLYKGKYISGRYKFSALQTEKTDHPGKYLFACF